MFPSFLCVTAHPKEYPSSFLLWQGAAPKSIPADKNSLHHPSPQCSKEGLKGAWRRGQPTHPLWMA